MASQNCSQDNCNLTWQPYSTYEVSNYLLFRIYLLSEFVKVSSQAFLIRTAWNFYLLLLESGSSNLNILMSNLTLLFFSKSEPMYNFYSQNFISWSLKFEYFEVNILRPQILIELYVKNSVEGLASSQNSEF